MPTSRPPPLTTGTRPPKALVGLGGHGEALSSSGGGDRPIGPSRGGKKEPFTPDMCARGAINVQISLLHEEHNFPSLARRCVEAPGESSSGVRESAAAVVGLLATPPSPHPPPRTSGDERSAERRNPWRRRAVTTSTVPSGMQLRKGTSAVAVAFEGAEIFYIGTSSSDRGGTDHQSNNNFIDYCT